MKTRKLAQKLSNIKKAAPQAKVLTINFILRASDGQVEVLLSPTTAAHEISTILKEDFKSEITGMASLYKPQNFYKFENYLSATGITEYLEAHKELAVIDSWNEDYVFDRPSYATDEDPIMNNKLFAKLTIEII